MELPHGNTQPKQRTVTGEIVYLDQMWQKNTFPKTYKTLGRKAIRNYEALAQTYASKERPGIMYLYEQYEDEPSAALASCTALADELLALKEPDSDFTFVDIVVEQSPAAVLEQLQKSAAGILLAADDEQLAIESDGEHYPILDMRKRNAHVTGVGLRVWGWDDKKYVFIDSEDEQNDDRRRALVYPDDEKSCTREFELSFGYRAEGAEDFSESIKLYFSTNGYATLSRSIVAGAYAETGYEGHAHKLVKDPSEEDILAFGSLVAEIVGDNPKSVAQKITERLAQVQENAATPAARKAIDDLIKATWPAQADYYLRCGLPDANRSLGEQLGDDAEADGAVAAIYELLKRWPVRSS